MTQAEMDRRDAERFRWLDKPERNWTFWMGYKSAHGYCTWPVFPGTRIGPEVDAAMEREQLRRSAAVMV